ncbi:MAG: L-seryl-tRNA(Sec) selenium transferase [SAR202 cluster bacterium Io17-Chloro-G9]|nr:MAG: L-seryl-tRNA(Sec) selenium transferase [SAR202 cluster bacterium Io17-Chloro-G9]
MQFRNLPNVNSVLANPALSGLADGPQRELVVDLVREELDRAREGIRRGEEAPPVDDLAQRVSQQLTVMTRREPRRVINATGVILHTNLGRAPLSGAALKAMEEAAGGYTNLELDLEDGRRGSRQAHLQSLLKRLTGAEAALAVNNNASAVLLGLSALASGKEVIVSRAEAVEIGGGFRIPDVCLQSGGYLVDVGTTNRTYIRDYEAAITGETAALLKVHASNFRVEGFTAAVEPGELVELGQRKGVAVLHDEGSGCLLPTEPYGLAHEPMPQESIAAGVGLVFFSGDKLLGAPQAGIVVGREDLVAQLARHPLARAVRIDKASLAGLTATLIHYLKGEAQQEIPIWRMISAPAKSVKERATGWQSKLECPAQVEESRSAIGGGSLPGETLASWSLTLDCRGATGGPQGVMERLRRWDPPVVARIEEDRVMLDPRTVLPHEEEDLLDAVTSAMTV